MGIRHLRPTTNARRFSSVDDFSDVTMKKPFKSLLRKKKFSAGRNNQGRLTAPRKGGGHKKMLRIIDFLREKFDIPAKVETIEYDPNRSGRIARIVYADGERRYIPAPMGLNIGQTILSSQKKVEIRPGNRMPLEWIPTGEMVSVVELHPGSGGILARAAGRGIIILGIEGNYCHVKLPSGEERLILKQAAATIGQMSNPDHRLIRLGKAGRKRWLGLKPHVRGKAKNPVDHPHGGGEGHNPIGLKHPKTPSGKPAFGVLTRKKNRSSNRLILKHRHLHS